MGNVIDLVPTSQVQASKELDAAMDRVLGPQENDTNSLIGLQAITSTELVVYEPTDTHKGLKVVYLPSTSMDPTVMVKMQRLQHVFREIQATDLGPEPAPEAVQTFATKVTELKHEMAVYLRVVLSRWSLDDPLTTANLEAAGLEIMTSIFKKIRERNNVGEVSGSTSTTGS